MRGGKQRAYVVEEKGEGEDRGEKKGIGKEVKEVQEEE